MSEPHDRALPKTKTKVMMNMAVPAGALVHAKKADAVGLLRIEFVYGSNVGIHPGALLQYEKLFFLVKNGVDSISLNPDAIGRMKKVVAEVEERQGGKDQSF